LLFDGTFLAGVDYTIFVVEQPRSGTPYYFLGTDFVNSTANTVLQFGYIFDSSAIRVSHGDFTSEFYMVAMTPYSGTPTAKLHTFVNGTIAFGGTIVNHYLNGSSTVSTKIASTGTQPSTLLFYQGNATIGSTNNAYFYNGDIGEIIIYTRYLKNEERIAVEDYLLKKWGIAGL
jgi:hypothetical protein